jgi:hypothetical protein
VILQDTKVLSTTLDSPSVICRHSLATHSSPSFQLPQKRRQNGYLNYPPLLTTGRFSIVFPRSMSKSMRMSLEHRRSCGLSPLKERKRQFLSSNCIKRVTLQVNVRYKDRDALSTIHFQTSSFTDIQRYSIIRI